MKELRLRFKGVDDWNRPVFVDDNGNFFGDTDHLFGYGTSREEVLDFYKDMTLNNYISYFGRQFGCEPMGDSIGADVKIVLV